jgi:alpha/beta superfamily hydrolase
VFRGTAESGRVVAIVPPDGLKNGQKTLKNTLNRAKALVSSDFETVRAGVCR